MYVLMLVVILTSDKGISKYGYIYLFVFTMLYSYVLMLVVIHVLTLYF